MESMTVDSRGAETHTSGGLAGGCKADSRLYMVTTCRQFRSCLLYSCLKCYIHTFSTSCWTLPCRRRVPNPSSSPHWSSSLTISVIQTESTENLISPLALHGLPWRLRW